MPCQPAETSRSMFDFEGCSVCTEDPLTTLQNKLGRRHVTVAVVATAQYSTLEPKVTGSDSKLSSWVVAQLASILSLSLASILSLYGVHSDVWESSQQGGIQSYGLTLGTWVKKPDRL